MMRWVTFEEYFTIVLVQYEGKSWQACVGIKQCWGHNSSNPYIPHSLFSPAWGGSFWNDMRNGHCHDKNSADLHQVTIRSRDNDT